MLRRLDVKFVEPWHGFDEYYVYYDDEYMTSEQAEKELEFMDWGMGYDPEKYPYYFILSHLLIVHTDIRRRQNRSQIQDFDL